MTDDPDLLLEPPGEHPLDVAEHARAQRAHELLLQTTPWAERTREYWRKAAIAAGLEHLAEDEMRAWYWINEKPPHEDLADRGKHQAAKRAALRASNGHDDGDQDDDDRPPPKEADDTQGIEPHLPLPFLACPPAWTDERVEQEAQSALQALSRNGRATPPRLLTLQLLDRFIARGERPSASVLELLKSSFRFTLPASLRGMRLRANIRKAYQEGRDSKDIAAELGIDKEVVEHWRTSDDPDRDALYAAAAEGQDLRAMRPAFAEALGLLDEDGWRTEVRKRFSAIPAHSESILVGVKYDEHGDAVFVFEEREIAACDGLIHRALYMRAARKEAKVREGARIEAEEEAKKLGLGRKERQALIAERIASVKNDKVKIARAVTRDRSERRDIRKWIEVRSDWEPLVRGMISNLRGGLLPRPKDRADL